MEPNTPTAPWWAPYSLAYAILLVFAAALGAMIWKGSADQVSTMITATISITMGVVGFFFGSSMGSQKKDDTIASTAASLATSAPVVIPQRPPVPAQP